MGRAIKFWLLAMRPKTLTASIVPVLVGSALAARQGPQHLWWVTICSLGGALSIQIATNFFNDAIDFAKGADTHERLGPMRVTQSGVFSSRQVMAMGGFFLCLALAFGIPLVIRGGAPIVAVGLTSLFLAYGYTGGPWPLAYRGLGDIFVLIFFGLIAVGGVYFLHAQDYNSAALVAGLQVGCLATILIAVNNLRDLEQDKRANKKTLAVRWGQNFAKTEIAFLTVAPFVLGVWWYSHHSIWASILPLLTLAFAVSQVMLPIWRGAKGLELNQSLARAAQLHLLFGIFLGLGILW